MIIGADGFLGFNLIHIHTHRLILGKNVKIVAADHHKNPHNYSFPYLSLDITEKNRCIQKILNINPDIIILTAAMTNVDKCELEKELALKVNTAGTKNVIEACEKTDAKLVFLSTDFVFDGEKKASYTEKDMPNPLNYYGETKLLAEKEIKNSALDYLICRTAVLYGANSTKLNFITWIIKSLQEKNPISIVTNQINSPTYVENLAEIIWELIQNEASGIFHTAGDRAYNRYEMAVMCAKFFDLDKRLITPVRDFKQVATRPFNAGLDVSKLKRFLGNNIKIFDLEDGLKHMKEQYNFPSVL